MAQLNTETISITVTSSTKTVPNIGKTITAGDVDAYILELTFSDVTAIVGTCNLKWIRSDGQQTNAAGTIVGNKVTYTLAAGLYAVAGNLQCWVQFFNSNIHTQLKITFNGIRVPTPGPEITDLTPYPDWLAAIEDAEDAADAATLAAGTAAQATIDANEAEAATEGAEALRVTAEGTRVSTEGNRVTAENGRVSAEGLRVTAEGNRVTAENGRVSAEGGRVTAEGGRVTAEGLRVIAESARGTAIGTLANLTTDYKTNLVGAVNEVDAQLAHVARRFNATTLRITNDNDRLQTWPQGKSFVYNNSIYVLFNEGSSHVSTDLEVKRYRSKDGGLSWVNQGSLYRAPTYYGGATCWAAGTDTRFYMIVRLRGVDYTTANTLHKFCYGTISGGEMPATLVEKTINISKDGKVPVLFHSFASLPDGSKAFGYHYEDGEVGIAKTSDLGDTWTTYPIYTSAEMGAAVLLCEPTLYYDADLNKTVGFLRSQNYNTRQPEFFVSSDNCETFTKYATDISVSESPVPICKMGSSYYAMSNERTGSGIIKTYEALASEAVTSGWSSFTESVLGEASYFGLDVSSGTGAGSLVVLNGNLHLFYGSEEQTGKPNIYETIITEISETDTINIKSAYPTNPFNPFRGALVGLTAAQTIATDTATNVSWDRIIYDTDAFYKTATPTKFVIPSGVSMVKISTNIMWGNSAVGDGQVAIIKGSAPVDGSAQQRMRMPNAGSLNMNVSSAIFPVVKDETFTIQVTQTTGGNLTVQALNRTWFQIEVIA